MNEDEKSKWMTVEDILADAESTQHLEVTWKGKSFHIIYRFLDNERAEVPPEVEESMADIKTPEVRERLFIEAMSQEIAWLMIDKGQREDVKAEALRFTRKEYYKLPKTLRGLISTNVIGASDAKISRF